MTLLRCQQATSWCSSECLAIEKTFQVAGSGTKVAKMLWHASLITKMSVGSVKAMFTASSSGARACAISSTQSYPKIKLSRSDTRSTTILAPRKTKTSCTPMAIWSTVHLRIRFPISALLSLAGDIWKCMSFKSSTKGLKSAKQPLISHAHLDRSESVPQSANSVMKTKLGTATLQSSKKGSEWPIAGEASLQRTYDTRDLT